MCSRYAYPRRSTICPTVICYELTARDKFELPHQQIVTNKVLNITSRKKTVKCGIASLPYRLQGLLLNCSQDACLILRCCGGSGLKTEGAVRPCVPLVYSSLVRLLRASQSAFCCLQAACVLPRRPIVITATLQCFSVNDWQQ